ncbi:MAG TPA: hypothetical protein VNQ90_15620 [Chthoniobacteraceae bacterium]|nr:hypothetical protein [Chthoniobacteraceae bacterium]
MHIPGLQEAIEREARIRASACWPGYTTELCGVPVRIMTLRDLLFLDLARNPFVCGGVPTAEDIAQFLWIISPEFGAFRDRAFWVFDRPRWSENRARRRFTRSLRHIPTGEAIEAIQTYLEEIFLDTPPSARGADNEAPLMHFFASLVSAVAIAFGWSRDTIERLPMPLLYQYTRFIRDHEAARAGVSIPAMSKFRDRAKSAALRAHAAQKKK